MVMLFAAEIELKYFYQAPSSSSPFSDTGAISTLLHLGGGCRQALWLGGSVKLLPPASAEAAAVPPDSSVP